MRPPRSLLYWPVLGIALAPLLMALLGLTHPTDLTTSTVHHWTRLHLWLIPLFPLIGVNLWWLLSDLRGWLPWAARLGAFVYGVYYPAVDLLAGVATGRLLSSGVDRDAPAISTLFQQGNALGDIGNMGLLLSCVLTIAALWPLRGRALLPGAGCLLLGAWLFTENHIYRPWGVLAMLLLAVGFAALMWVRQRPAKQANPEYRVN
ncbi:hypothetical protein [Deinococcus sp. QL22]|uniref:hypothetical protein n=1 Tax=Deinococcus sp. QL22 TaxID=2939437 RepID=UPI0020172B01|nr:hypothetical protein [Deinococcus sp. QL22]UQN05511.1 hypothetical protein M1R55_11555 [Deinococcus sp. QL22]